MRQVNTIIQGDALAVLKTLPDCHVQCVVTSPPYWGLRDYGVAGQLGLEATPAEYVAKIVEIFREVRRVLKDDGTLWLNMGDCYAHNGACGGGSPVDARKPEYGRVGYEGDKFGGRAQDAVAQRKMKYAVPVGLKVKDLVGQPWRVAFALQADGWYLRSDIIWHKPNPMPESIRDRPTKAHEYLFLLSKSERYYYDAEAIKQPVSPNTHARISQDLELQRGSERAHARGKTNGRMKAVLTPKALAAVRGTGVGFGHGYDANPKNRVKSCSTFSGMTLDRVAVRNSRSVWTIPTRGYKGAHFATFPPALVEPCIRAGCMADGIVLDPFMGAGTTALVAAKLGRRWLGIELSGEYIKLAMQRLGLFAVEANA